MFIRDGVEEPSLYELGLCSDAIRISPNYVHKPVYTNDFGPEIPAETMWMLSDVDIKMTLIHFDESVLKACLRNSMGNCGSLYDGGTLAPAGTLLGRNKPQFTSGNQFLSLTILNGYDFHEELTFPDPWNFPSAYLTSPTPFVWPLGTEKSQITLNWKAIPYAPLNASGEAISSGVVLWQRVADAGEIQNNDINSPGP